MNIYLDVNGVVLQRNLTLAIGITDFLKKALEKHKVYWLTTHCKGSVEPVLNYLKGKLPNEAFELAKHIKPTNWDVLKTDGIDFSKDFLWFDDYLMQSEQQVLMKHNCQDKHVFVDLEKYPEQLKKYFLE